MERPFAYDHYVTGKNFVGRKTDCTGLSNLLEAGEHVCIYDAPRTGKSSLVQQTLFNMRASGKQFMVAYINVFNVRTRRDFLKKFGAAVLRSAYSTPADYEMAIERYLANTHFVFDSAQFASKEDIVCMNWDADNNDVLQMMRLPGQIALEKGVPFYIIFKDFQNIMMTEDFEDTLKVMESMFADKHSYGDSTFIFTGSMVNAMKYIFAETLYGTSMCEMVQKEADVEVIYLDPLNRGEYDKDSYLNGMRNNLKMLKAAFQ